MRDDTLKRSAIYDAHRRLERAGIVAPLSHDPAETRAWMDCDLASMVENRCFAEIDPRTLSDQERAHWESRALSARFHPGDPHDDAFYRLPYWILEGGQRAGSVALETSVTDGQLLGVSSLYLFPDRRGHGVARALLDATKAAASEKGLPGIRLGTDWTWQKPLSYYMRLGMWVRSWKHQIVLAWTDDLPAHRTEFASDTARFLVDGGGTDVGLIEATRQGDRLGWRELDCPDSLDPEVLRLAPGTLALSLALAGWPLLREDKSWAKRHESSDFGSPEGLARKIEIFEAVERGEGFEVRTPRIPGLRYRDLDQIDS